MLMFLKTIKYKTFVATVLRQRDTTAYCCQNFKLILLHSSQCSPEIIIFQIIVS